MHVQSRLPPRAQRAQLRAVAAGRSAWEWWLAGARQAPSLAVFRARSAAPRPLSPFSVLDALPLASRQQCFAGAVGRAMERFIVSIVVTRDSALKRAGAALTVVRKRVTR